MEVPACTPYLYPWVALRTGSVGPSGDQFRIVLMAADLAGAIHHFPGSRARAAGSCSLRGTS